MAIETQSTLSTIHAMLHQEECGYRTGDFLRDDSLSAQNGEASANIIDVDCRDKMVVWYYQVVDFLKLQHETVEIAVSYLDRFMLTEAGKSAYSDRAEYQLAAMTALYTAVKIHEPTAISPSLIAQLSRGTYSVEQVETMETKMLFALEWRLNPPTILAFVRHFMNLIPRETLTKTSEATFYDMCVSQSEMATSRYEFIACRSSYVAFCAFMNSLSCVKIDEKLYNYLGFTIGDLIGVDYLNDPTLLDVQHSLSKAVINHAASISMRISKTMPPKEATEKSIDKSFAVSPRSTRVPTDSR